MAAANKQRAAELAQGLERVDRTLTAMGGATDATWADMRAAELKEVDEVRTWWNQYMAGRSKRSQVSNNWTQENSVVSIGSCSGARDHTDCRECDLRLLPTWHVRHISVEACGRLVRKPMCVVTVDRANHGLREV